MARIQHLAIASLDPEKQAEFYKKVFGFEEVRRLDNPRARGVVLTDGHINISVLNFQQGLPWTISLLAASAAWRPVPNSPDADRSIIFAHFPGQ